MNNKIKKLTFTKLIPVFIFLFIATPAYGAADLEIGTACTDNAECKTNLCELSTLTSTPNKFCVCSTALHCEEKYTKAAGETWECKAKSPQSQGLPYCQSDPNGVKYPITPESITPPTTVAGVVGSLLTPTTTMKMSPPKISIPIPELPEWAEIDVTPGSQVNVPYIAQYIIALYKYALVIGSIMAVMALMAGGIMYMMGGMNATLITKAKTLIFGSISGIIILISSYLVLNIINPNLTKLTAIQIETIKGVLMEEYVPEYSEGPDSTTDAGGGVTADSGLKPGTGGQGFKGMDGFTYTPIKDKKCINDYFFDGKLDFGSNVHTVSTRIPILGLDDFWNRSTPSLPVKATGKDLARITKAKEGKGFLVEVHNKSIPAWKDITNKLISSSDPEIKGYMQYIWDYADGKAPSLSGSFGPGGVVSTYVACGAGYARRKCPSIEKMGSPYSDPHVLALAVDIMTTSNNDNHSAKSKSKKGGSSEKTCATYK